MRIFKNIGALIRIKRMTHPNRYSQLKLANMLGHKNGQFISNVERSLCSIPLKMLKKTAEILDIDRQKLKEVLLEDYGSTLDSYLGFPVDNKASVEDLDATRQQQKEFEDVKIAQNQ